MVKKNLWLGMLVIVSSVAAIGCRSLDVEHMAQFTVASTLTVDLSRLGEFNRTVNVVTGESRRRLNFFNNWQGDIDRRMERAIDNAIRSVPGGVAMVDLRIEQSTRYSFFRSRPDHRITASGTVLVDPRIISSIESDESLLTVQTTGGEIIALVPITDDELRSILGKPIYFVSR